MSLALATKGRICHGSRGVGLATRGVVCILGPPAVVVDFTIPLHITQLKAGDQVRIVISPLIIYRPTVGRNRIIAPVKGGRLRSADRVVLMGLVSSNDPVNGTISLQVIKAVFGEVLPAVVQYSHIGIIQRVVPNNIGFVETAPISRPGAIAKGTSLIGGQLLNSRDRLVPVKF